MKQINERCTSRGRGGGRSLSLVMNYSFSVSSRYLFWEGPGMPESHQLTCTACTKCPAGPGHTWPCTSSAAETPFRPAAAAVAPPTWVLTPARHAPAERWRRRPRPPAPSCASSSCFAHSCPWPTIPGTSACAAVAPSWPARSTWPARHGSGCATCDPGSG